MAKGKVTLTPDRITDKWQRRMKGSVQDIQAGLDAMQIDPGQAAVAKQDKMLQNIQRSITDGTWAKRRLAVSKQQFVEVTKRKVAQRLSSGVDEALPKRQRFDNYLVNTLNSVLPQIQNMPDMTLEDSVNRVRALMEHMSNNPYKKQ